MEKRKRNGKQEKEQEQSLIHISHCILSYLTNVEAQDHQLCHAGRAYRCAPCGYSLHATCARLRRTLHHPAHPAHPLTLLLTPPHADGAFTLHCSRCRFDLHSPCAATPPTLTHDRSLPHPHALALVHGSPGRAGYVCDLCRGECDVSRWFYACTSCDFGGHVGCFASSCTCSKQIIGKGRRKRRSPAAAADGQDQAHRSLGGGDE